MSSSEVWALCLAPTRSKSRLTATASRRGVPLKVMCSRKCETPASSLDSSRLPVLTKKPAATECARSFSSAMTWSPLSSVV